LTGVFSPNSASSKYVESGQDAVLQSWYALHVKHETEALVSAALTYFGVEAFYPSTTVEARQYRLGFQRPFFPGYVFSRFDHSKRTPVIRIPQVLHILGSGSEPTVIPDSEIEAVRIMSASAIASPCPFLAHGVRVLIRSGRLAGVEGIVVRLKNKTRVVVSINMMERSCSAEVDADSLELAKATA
jgi:transcriptional antiterminator NusG